MPTVVLCERCGAPRYAGQPCGECGERHMLPPEIRDANHERARRHAAEMAAAANAAACTARCRQGTIHALDCANYSGPLSKTGTIGQPEGPEVTW